MTTMIIDKVVEAEEKAKNIIQQAREKAASLKTTAENEINESIKSAYEKAQLLIRESVSVVQEQVNKEYEKEMNETEKQNVQFLEKNKDRPDIIQKVIKLITTVEFQKEL